MDASLIQHTPVAHAVRGDATRKGFPKPVRPFVVGEGA